MRTSRPIHSNRMVIWPPQESTDWWNRGFNTFNGEASNITNSVAFDLKDLFELNSHFIKPMCVSFLHGF